MKTIRRLIYREVLISIAFVALGFLGLFFFFDLVDELQAVGKSGPNGYTLSFALLYVTLLIPSHLYELLPIFVLIGTIFVMARFRPKLGVHHFANQRAGPLAGTAHTVGPGPGFCGADFCLWRLPGPSE